MPAEKRNAYLDAEESEEENEGGYDSELDELRKGGHDSKRRKVYGESDADLSSDDDEATTQQPSGLSELLVEERDEDEDEEGAAGANDPPLQGKSSQKAASTELPGVSKPLTKKNLVATEAAVKKSGVLYISRCPPYLTPHKIRSLLQNYGQINRIFLTPEDEMARSRRVRSGGNKRKTYTDGWAEFVNKKDAKRACELLNAQTIGGPKGSWYRDDIWSLRYLKGGFKWHHLTEQINAERAERASRLRAEISKTTKENKEFVRNVEKGKMLEGMQNKKAAKKRRKSESGYDGEVDAVGNMPEKRRSFKQIPLARKQEKAEQPDQVQRVLSKIF